MVSTALNLKEKIEDTKDDEVETETENFAVVEATEEHSSMVKLMNFSRGTSDIIVQPLKPPPLQQQVCLWNKSDMAYAFSHAFDKVAQESYTIYQNINGDSMEGYRIEDSFLHFIKNWVKGKAIFRYFPESTDADETIVQELFIDILRAGASNRFTLTSNNMIQFYRDWIASGVAVDFVTSFIMNYYDRTGANPHSEITPTGIVTNQNFQWATLRVLKYVRASPKYYTATPAGSGATAAVHMTMCCLETNIGRSDEDILSELYELSDEQIRELISAEISTDHDGLIRTNTNRRVLQDIKSLKSAALQVLYKGCKGFYISPVELSKLGRARRRVWNALQLIRDDVGDNPKALVVPPITQRMRNLIFVTTDEEHHSNLLPWREISASTRRCVTWSRENLLNKSMRGQLMEACASRGLIPIFSLSAGSNLTGARLTEEQLGEISKDVHGAGGKLFIDYAGAGPYVQVDISRTNADALFMAFHKFVGGLGTPGSLIIRKDMMKSGKAPIPGGGTVSAVTLRRTFYHRDSQNLITPGTPNGRGWFQVGLVMFLYELVGAKTIETIEHSLSEEMCDFFNHLRFIEPLNGKLNKNDLPIQTVNVSAGRWDEAPISSANRIPQFWHHSYISAFLANWFGVEVRDGCFCNGPGFIKLANYPESDAVKLVDIFHGKGLHLFKPGSVRDTTHFLSTRDDIEMQKFCWRSTIFAGFLLEDFSVDIRTGTFSFDKPKGKNAREILHTQIKNQHSVCESIELCPEVIRSEYFGDAKRRFAMWTASKVLAHVQNATQGNYFSTKVDVKRIQEEQGQLMVYKSKDIELVAGVVISYCEGAITELTFRRTLKELVRSSFCSIQEAKEFVDSHLMIDSPSNDPRFTDLLDKFEDDDYPHAFFFVHAKDVHSFEEDGILFNLKNSSTGEYFVNGQSTCSAGRCK